MRQARAQVEKQELALKRNVVLIDEFVQSLGILSPRREKKYRLTLGKISREIGPFEDRKEADLKRYIEEINASDYADWTKRDYRVITKKFFTWLHNREFVDWIRLGNPKATIGPEDILNEKELSLLRFACKSLRDKAAIETLYETACRPHEFLGLKKSNVTFDDYGALVHVEKGKTGPRRIRVVNAAPLLANWIENHPLKPRDAPLWVDLSNNTTYEGLHWLGLGKLVRRLTKTAGIEKNVHPYIFRHTRLTHLAKFMTEAQLCIFAGWEQGSDMPRMYVHLSGKDVDAALLKSYGLIGQEKESPVAKAPKKCVRCGATCSAEAETCSRCGMALTLEAALHKDEELAEIKRNQARILELLEKGVKVNPALLNLKKEDVPMGQSDK